MSPFIVPPSVAHWISSMFSHLRGAGGGEVPAPSLIPPAVLAPTGELLGPTLPSNVGTGFQGVQGVQGVSGFHGVAGFTGIQGFTGLHGATGCQGPLEDIGPRDWSPRTRNCVCHKRPAKCTCKKRVKGEGEEDVSSS